MKLSAEHIKSLGSIIYTEPTKEQLLEEFMAKGGFTPLGDYMIVIPADAKRELDKFPGELPWWATYSQGENEIYVVRTARLVQIEDVS